MKSLVAKVLINNRPPLAMEPAEIEHELADGQELDFAGGLCALHTPGHSLGHLVFLYPKQGGVLFVGDAVGDIRGLDYSIIYEDLEEGKRSLRKIGQLQFESAVFGHGKPILHDAAGQFRRRFA